MKVGLTISFQKDSIDGKLLISLFDKYIKFTPYIYTKKNSSKPWNSKKHPKEISKLKSDDNFIIHDLDENIFSATTTGTTAPHKSLQITQDEDAFFPSDEEILDITNFGNFVAAYFYNDAYRRIQSVESETLLEGYNYPKELIDSIRNTPFRLDAFDKKRYETRFNAGRMILIQYTWLMSAWKMWFGKPFFELVPRERILAFPHAIQIKELNEDIVFVQLYADIANPTDPDSVFRQWKWQEWLNFDGLIEKYE